MTLEIPVLSTTEHQAQAVFRVLLDYRRGPAEGAVCPRCCRMAATMIICSPCWKAW